VEIGRCEGRLISSLKRNNTLLAIILKCLFIVVSPFFFITILSKKKKLTAVAKTLIKIRIVKRYLPMI